MTGLRCPSCTDAVTGGDRHRRELLEHARPVAARNGWLVLELQQERYTDGLTLCLCNPTRGGDMALLPPLTGAADNHRPRPRPATAIVGFLPADHSLQPSQLHGAALLLVGHPTLEHGAYKDVGPKDGEP